MSSINFVSFISLIYLCKEVKNISSIFRDNVGFITYSNNDEDDDNFNSVEEVESIDLFEEKTRKDLIKQNEEDIKNSLIE